MVLHKELDADDGELTRTRKVRRRYIAEKYEPVVHALYSDMDHCWVEAQVRFEDGRTGTVRAQLAGSRGEDFPAARRRRKAA